MGRKGRGRVIIGEMERQKGVEGRGEGSCRFPDAELHPL